MATWILQELSAIPHVPRSTIVLIIIPRATWQAPRVTETIPNEACSREIVGAYYNPRIGS